MKNYQRLMALTLASSIMMTSIASSRVWADDGIRLEDHSVSQQETVRKTRIVMVPKEVPYEEVQTRQGKATDIVRDNSENLTCKAYSGPSWDQERLQAKYDELRLKHAENWVQKPDSGSIVTGAVAGAALTVVTGGLALVGAAIGGLVGGLFSWFRGGKTDEERDLAKRARDAQYDQESLELNCLENALNRAKRYPASAVYAGSIPSQMPVGVNTSVETKPVVVSVGSSSGGSSTGGSSTSGSSTGGASLGGSSSGSSTTQPASSNGSADGGLSCSGGPGSPCAGGAGNGSDFYDKDGREDSNYVFTDSYHYPAAQDAPSSSSSEQADTSCPR